MLAEDFKVNRVGSDEGKESTVAAPTSKLGAGKRLLEGDMQTESKCLLRGPARG